MKLKDYIFNVMIQSLNALTEVPSAKFPPYIDFEINVMPIKMGVDIENGHKIIEEIHVIEDPNASKLKFRVEIK
jgi:hypothetical protein